MLGKTARRTMYDARNNPLPEIALTAAALGGCFSGCVCLLLFSKYARLSVYLISVCVYFMLEFIQTARYQPSKVTSKLFLIYGRNGNREFLIVQLVSIWEHLLMRSRFTPHKVTDSLLWLIVGLTTAISGQVLRSTAMGTCGESFSHIIETSPENQSKKMHPGLVTTGVYAFTRHPSYLGFWLFVVGLEICLQNWFTLIVSIITLSWFFNKRIAFEEWFLVNRLYGEQYIEYKRKVGIWIPFVWSQSQ